MQTTTLQDAIEFITEYAAQQQVNIDWTTSVWEKNQARMVTIMADPTGDYAVSLGELVK